MRHSTRKIIVAVAAEHGVTVQRLLSPSRIPRLVAARVAAARRLRESPMTVTQIGNALRRDHTTISFYLGGVAGKKPRGPQELRWSRPRIRGLTSCRKVKLCWSKPLVPYAGASFDNVWKERGYGRR